MDNDLKNVLCLNINQNIEKIFTDILNEYCIELV